jgi:hypothetical protein
MGNLDKPKGANVKREIRITDVTNVTIANIESQYNTNFGQNGWRIVQLVVIGANRYVIAEREL